MTARKSSVRVEDVNLPDADGPTYESDPLSTDVHTTPEIEETAGQDRRTALIGHHSMRVLMSLFKRHGITTDSSQFDWLTLKLGREISSRKDITATEAAHLIADLDAAPAAPDPDVWAALAAPFPPDQVEKLPKILRRDDQNKGRCGQGFSADGYDCGGWHSRAIHLDYVGHAGVTMRLNEVVTPAGWSWEPVAFNPDGTPNTGREFWIRLTVLGVTKYGVGDDFSGSAKQAIGDALRNAALRFGIATYLWSKSDASKVIAAGGDPESHVVGAGSQPLIGAGTPVTPQPDSSGPVQDDLSELGTAELLLIVDKYAGEQGQTFEQFTLRWRSTDLASQGGNPMPVDDMDDLPPETVAAYIRRVRHHLAQTGAQG